MAILNERYEPSVPLSELIELVNNPRRGDVGLLQESVSTIGFYGAVIVNERKGVETSGQVLAGNHRIKALHAEGESTVPVIYVDVDDITARKISLIDNHANDRASYDVGDLLLSLEALDNDFKGTGYSEDDYADLLAHTTAPTLEELEGELGDDEDAALTVKVSLEITATSRNRWEGFRSAFGSDEDAFSHLLDNAGVEDDA